MSTKGSAGGALTETAPDSDGTFSIALDGVAVASITLIPGDPLIYVYPT